MFSEKTWRYNKNYIKIALCKLIFCKVCLNKHGTLI